MTRRFFGRNWSRGFDTLKLDKTFLQEGNNERNRKVIKNIIRMAKELNMSIVSEGIGTEKDADRKF